MPPVTLHDGFTSLPSTPDNAAPKPKAKSESHPIRTGLELLGAISVYKTAYWWKRGLVAWTKKFTSGEVEMSGVADTAPINAGEVFITGGFPGHVVLVLDRATNPDTGETVFLLGQGYMPAQDFHLLKNPKDAALSPWYKATTPLNTPEWIFAAGSRRRF
jgi:hypothetical protein